VPSGLLPPALALLLTRILAWNMYLASLARPRSPRSTVIALLRIRRGFLLGGHLVPGVLLLSVWIFPGAALPLTAAAGAMMTLSGWLLKIILVTRAAYIPKFTAPMAPVRGSRSPDTGATDFQTRRPV
ncbi:MAG TPA: hypothetical protein VE175_07870, partial [Woeseiaceae bacterium]|nr:hypothetical protein [Woeseiaceae bacterium]